MRCKKISRGEVRDHTDTCEFVIMQSQLRKGYGIFCHLEYDFRRAVRQRLQRVNNLTVVPGAENGAHHPGKLCRSIVSVIKKPHHMQEKIFGSFFKTDHFIFGYPD